MCKIKNILMWVAKKIASCPKIKKMVLSFLNRFPGLRLRLKNFVKNQKYEIFSSDFLSEDPNTLSFRGRQIYNDLLKEINNQKGG